MLSAEAKDLFVLLEIFSLNTVRRRNTLQEVQKVLLSHPPAPARQDVHVTIERRDEEVHTTLRMSRSPSN